MGLCSFVQALPFPQKCETMRSSKLEVTPIYHLESRSFKTYPSIMLFRKGNGKILEGWDAVEAIREGSWVRYRVVIGSVK